MSDHVESRIARIESDVQHIKTDTADLRVEQRRTNDKIDVTNKRIEEVRDSLSTKMDAGYKELSEKIDSGDKELGSDYKELSKKIDDVHHSLKDKLHSMTVWALLLYVTLAGGLLTIIARAFKWI